MSSDPNFQVRDAKRFLERFETAPGSEKMINGRPIALTEVDYYRFQENKNVLDKLQEIAALWHGLKILMTGNSNDLKN